MAYTSRNCISLVRILKREKVVFTSYSVVRPR
uniref:Uncharacterized protein n=1 Tax=Arundo donax TaxID=35708 RepID=A0A0A8YWY8_ARUDO